MAPPNLNYKRCYVDWGGRCAYCGIGLPRIKWDGKVRAGIEAAQRYAWCRVRGQLLDVYARALGRTSVRPPGAQTAIAP